MTSDPVPAPRMLPDDEALLCPLCDYDLRGQVEPRCPECGYAFDWEELRDPTRKLHPYLFEHHPERNIWSWRKTFWGSLRPQKFWADLYPTQRSNSPRLIIYWLIVTFLFLVPYAGQLGLAAVLVHGQNNVGRTRAPTWMGPAEKQRMIKLFGSMQNWLDATYPVLPSPRVLMDAVQSHWFRSNGLVGMCILAWPWMTMAALMVFQASMRKAKVKPVHVLRCVIYSADGMICGSLAMLGWLVLVISPTGTRGGYYGSTQFTKNILLFLLVALTYRLWIAYRKYLRFDHALATVIASQVMVGLLILKIGLDWRMLSW